MFEVVVLVAAITSGLIAGLFFGFSISVMLALKQVDDKVFVDVMQRINRTIQNGVFGLVFMASLLASVAIPVIDLTNGGGVDVLAVAGAALVLLSMVFTFGVNIPLNNRLDAAGPVARAKDVGGARQAFEGPWVRFNHLRGLAAAAGFVLLCLSI
ncbi:MAG TPA: anthrone oxygenase family protein [Actinokineospora sp.]|jgi:uncharacterized membrane protein|nr:anthrone oxygenase family protein [Actinokineospora sp.]